MHAFDDALALAGRSGDARLVSLMTMFGAVGQIVVGDDDAARAALAPLDATTSDDGYDHFILNWARWMLGLAERDAAAARRWISRQHEFLERTGIVETWITSFSTALCDAADGADIRRQLAHTLALADQEGYDAGADCLLVVAYAEMGDGEFEAAAELVGTALHDHFNATAHYVLYCAVIDRSLRAHLDPAVCAAAEARGRSRTATDALAERGITRPRRATARPEER